MFLKLTIPTNQHRDQVWAYKEAFVRIGEKACGSRGLMSSKSYDEWLSGIGPTDHVFLSVVDDEMVGIIAYRPCISEELAKTIGHIGYSIHPKQRGKGYGKEQLRQCLEFAAKSELQRVFIVCHKKNRASAFTIISCGGEYVESFVQDGEEMERYLVILNN